LKGNFLPVLSSRAWRSSPLLLLLLLLFVLGFHASLENGLAMGRAGSEEGLLGCLVLLLLPFLHPFRIPEAMERRDGWKQATLSAPRLFLFIGRGHQNDKSRGQLFNSFHKCQKIEDVNPSMPLI
jgi:hypothetical protein